WSNWVSPKKRMVVSPVAGATKDLAAVASLADQLEGIITAGIDAHESGDGAARAGGVNRTRDGLLPGGVPKMLEGPFCDTELNHRSPDTTLGLPAEVFFDPAVTAGASLVYPDPEAGSGPIPFLFPIRSERDALSERVLVKRGYLTDGMAVAIRLIDDEND